MFALALLLAAADLPPVQATAPAAAPARQSLFDVVSQKLSPEGRPAFQSFVTDTLIPRVRTDRAAEVKYLQSLQALVRAAALDVDTVAALIDQRKATEAAETADIRARAFAMIKSLPVADRKLALTAIFAETRLPAAPPAAAPTPAPTSKKHK